MATKKTAAVVTVSKLGTTRAGERSRIWLEGKRLSAHGFTRGTPFYVMTHPKGWAITTDAPSVHTDAVKAGTVAGTAERPIIDTVGALVYEAFGRDTHVRCTFAQGVIVVESCNARGEV